MENVIGTIARSAHKPTVENAAQQWPDLRVGELIRQLREYQKAAEALHRESPGGYSRYFADTYEATAVLLKKLNR